MASLAVWLQEDVLITAHVDQAHAPGHGGEAIQPPLQAGGNEASSHTRWSMMTGGLVDPNLMGINVKQ